MFDLLITKLVIFFPPEITTLLLLTKVDELDKRLVETPENIYKSAKVRTILFFLT